MRRIYAGLLGLTGFALVYSILEDIIAIAVYHDFLPDAFAALKYLLYVLLLGTLAGSLWWRWKQNGANFLDKQPKEIWLVAVLLTWCLVNLTYSSSTLWQSMRGLNADFAGLIVFLTIWLLRPGKMASWRLYGVITGILAFLAIVSLPEIWANTAFRQWTNHNLQNHFVVGTIPQLRSLVSGPNPFGTLLAFFAVALAVCWRWQTRYLVLVMVPIGFLLGLTYARSAWIGAAVAAGGYFFYRLKHGDWKTIWPLVLGAFIIIGATFGAIRSNESIVNVLTHGSSTEEHGETAVESLNATYEQTPAQTLFGHGLGTAGPVIFDTAEANKKDTIKIVESWYMQLIQEIGVIGFALYLWLYVTVTRALWRRSVLAGWLAIGLGVNAITLHIWSADATINLLFWAFAGLMLYGQLPVAKPANKA